eukprot:TRINITY_DN63437_c0_g1_i1.p1 TRINITY_DN63437_c0_g1~~TRINITY_DN63437_c0_g1_i1.p1  ORF type:complete len:305 (+),score=44.00 TRINITY_DN63437_c0_g1_i1:97-1011(+)
MGEFTLELTVLAAFAPSLAEQRRPRLEVALAGAWQETQAAVWNPKNGPEFRASHLLPSGQECPWRFGGAPLSFTASIDDLEAETALDFRLTAQSDLMLGPITLPLPHREVIGVAAANLSQHVLPICTPSQQIRDGMRLFQSSVQMVSLRRLDLRGGNESVGAIAVSFSLDADPKEILSAVAAARRRRHVDTDRDDFWFNCCSTDARERYLQDTSCACNLPIPAMLERSELDGSFKPPRPGPPPLASPEVSSEGWICRQGPGGRVFWHHLELGPPPWERAAKDVKDNRAFHRSIMGKAADLSVSR